MRDLPTAGACSLFGLSDIVSSDQGAKESPDTTTQDPAGSDTCNAEHANIEEGKVID
jgi:hypothetical protein